MLPVSRNATTWTALRPGTSDAAAASDKAVRHAKLAHAAQKFEAVMLAELLKPLEHTTAMGSTNEDQASNPMQAYRVEALAESLAHSGALGFASRIVTAVETPQ
jgi:Rod binding domain-containing protein